MKIRSRRRNVVAFAKFSREKPKAPLRIVMLCFADAQMLDITGPLEVFARTSRWLIDEGLAVEPAYELILAATRAGPLRMSSGLRLVADCALDQLPAPIDTLIVAGGRGVPTALRDRALTEFLRRTWPRVRRLCSVCTGAFILAEAGLLDGRAATTHWRACRDLAVRYPRVRVESDPIFVRDGNVFTSAGVTAGIDLALALVEQDRGRRVALAVARELVMFLRRPGGQSQFSVQLAAQAADREPIRELQTWIVDNPHTDLAVARLARRAAMSLRNFARVFARETGVTPADFVEQTRVEAARRRLEESSDGMEMIVAACGFGTRESMRRAFIRRLGVAPSTYRARFRSSNAA